MTYTLKKKLSEKNHLRGTTIILWPVYNDDAVVFVRLL